MKWDSIKTLTASTITGLCVIAFATLNYAYQKERLHCTGHSSGEMIGEWSLRVYREVCGLYIWHDENNQPHSYKNRFGENCFIEKEKTNNGSG